MNKKTLKRLGLDESATPEAIEEAINVALDRADALSAENDELKEALKKKAPAETPAQALDKRIRAKIADSGGALNYDQAKLAIEHQDAAKATKGKK